MITQTRIDDFHPSKAQFSFEDRISFLIKVRRHHQQVLAKLRIYYLHELIEEQEMNLSENNVEEIVLTRKKLLPGGYGAVLELWNASEELVCTAQTAFDVVNHWSEAPRYGFLSDFHPGQLGKTDDIDFLNSHHINVVQFYDWMYRHDQLLHPDKRQYTDPMERELSLDVVQEKIKLAHEKGMKTMAYGAMYASLKDFYEEHKEWALYQNDGLPYTLADTFYIMDISEDSPWNNVIIPELKQVIEWGFDGIHLDQYGFPKKALRRKDGRKEIVDLSECFTPFINRTVTALKQANEEAGLIFNNVSNFPTYATAQSDQDLVYIEVWSPINSFRDLKLLMDEAKSYADYKQVILAAYLGPFNPNSETFDQVKAENGALTTMATIFANGGFHLLIGEHYNVLTEGYYPNYGEMSLSFRQEIKHYYDFIVRYHDLLYNKELIDLSFTHTGGYVSEIGRDNEYEFECGDVVFAPHGHLGTVWTIIKENDKYLVIHFINLCGFNNDGWNEVKESRPNRIEGISAKVLMNEQLGGVYWASPDEKDISPQSLETKRVRGTNGYVYEVVLPSLDVWSMIYFVKA
ncbi:glycoside hydrolase family 66 protein [Gracilibacillus sp. YIM 98692]|uniref:glycoside hydrolase family 66 protein n=1 Tax=Gracilibacillus sp. YIM 98692 TaxID=2663532 RepID=UPI0013D7B66F|nr:glycoside hydrolase family 66 protein [Gracilibacillus sp. YIM 98692]